MEGIHTWLGWVSVVGVVLSVFPLLSKFLSARRSLKRLDQGVQFKVTDPASDSKTIRISVTYGVKETGAKSEESERSLTPEDVAIPNFKNAPDFIPVEPKRKKAEFRLKREEEDQRKKKGWERRDKEYERRLLERGDLEQLLKQLEVITVAVGNEVDASAIRFEIPKPPPLPLVVGDVKNVQNPVNPQ